MKIKFYGTRGSTPISNSQSLKYGGNTTCVHIDSLCLPEKEWLVIDAGTGIVPLSLSFLQTGGAKIDILFSHYHHDHTQGFPLSLFPYLKNIPVRLFGPFEHQIGPREVLESLMRPPFFPVNVKEVASHIKCHNLEFPNSSIVIAHPIGGIKIFNIDSFERLIADDRQMPMENGAFDVKECMVIRMHRSNHPEQTISYRFEERPTGKVFVFVTDHENQDGIPVSFKQHLRDTDLLVMDSQYTREKYDRVTVGWGHATPDYVARVAREAGAKRLGLTHHDPFSPDLTVDLIVETAQGILSDPPIEVFGCRDYLQIEL